MASGGHNKKTKAQAEREGTARKDRHTDPVVIAPGAPVKPTWLTTDAAEMWDEYVPLLTKAGVVEQVDAIGLTALFEAAVLANRAREQIGSEPVWEREQVDKHGNVHYDLVKHPGMGAWKEAVTVLRGLMADYGMSPMSRTKLGEGLQDPGDHGHKLPQGAPAPWTPKVLKGG